MSFRAFFLCVCIKSIGNDKNISVDPLLQEEISLRELHKKKFNPEMSETGIDSPKQN